MSIKRHGVGPRLSQAVVHGNTVYLAGIIAGDPSADAKGQTEQILKKIDEHLAAVGSHKSKLLSATIYVANMGIFGEMNSAWDAWIDPANTPARATVEARLAAPKYLVEIKPGQGWTDGRITVPLGGFSAADPPSWYHRILLAMVVPLRRETAHDWFHVVLRYGSVGGEEDFIEPDPDDYKLEATIKPKRSGEVFVFVNDAVVGIPGLYDLFYRGNKGTATLTITPK